ncbi:PD-(D/E)XK nuclease family protein [Chloroflexota bacterium]
MSNQIQISAKNLGELAMPHFCPRCFWLKLRLRNKLPFQIFPGIFSSIDSYTKNIINGYFDKYNRFPSWLGILGSLIGYKKSPHFSKFSIIDDDNNILLTGVPDSIYVKTDQSHVVVDYKTARYTGQQDKLMPMYEVQLNGYAMIGESCNFHPVSDLALIYMEPVTDSDAVNNESNHREDGFAMGFAANIHKVTLDLSIIPPLLAKTREINELSSAPDQSIGCKDCELLEDLLVVTSE